MGWGNPGSPALRPLPPFLDGGLERGHWDSYRGVINTDHGEQVPAQGYVAPSSQSTL